MVDVTEEVYVQKGNEVYILRLVTKNSTVVVKNKELVSELNKLESQGELKENTVYFPKNRIAYISTICKTTEKCMLEKCSYFVVWNGDYFCTKKKMR